MNICFCVYSMIPDYEHPITKESVKSLLKSSMSKNTPDAQPMRKVIPFPRHLSQNTPLEEPSAESIRVPPTLSYWTHPYRTCSVRTPGRKTRIMGIINVTPDSFSDGSQYATVTSALAHASESVAAGANVLDIGGYSTRPGATFVGTEQEIARVRPVIDAVRQAGSSGNLGKDKLADVIISVDTFRPEVAEAAILSGANCINDVYAFMGPTWWKGGEFDKGVVEEAGEYLKEMKRVARKYAVPVVLMHSRGDAGSNKDYGKYSYAREAVVEGVRIELGEKVDRIVKGKGGLRRWMIIVDVGIGFGKTVEGNLELLRSASKVTADCLVGPGSWSLC
jgi:dihydroneopterin aldolase/2-amino-4-hydroxy-6-hydroxymethyldihydropteridine diphosphokinase/dihydropteroate synthase